MKKYTNSCSGAIILLLAFTLVGCVIVKPVPGPKYVVLLVDTSGLTQGAEEKDFCSFPFQHGKSDADYKTHVFPGDPIKWLGISTTSEDDEVLIERIIFDEDPGVVGLTDGANALQGEGGMVSGSISENAKSGKISYNIEFTVIKNGSSTPYTLDPILRVH